MSDRDELTDLILEVMPDREYLTGQIVNRILARWRLVPVEEAPVHVEDCPLCRHPWDHHNRMGCQDCKVCIMSSSSLMGLIRAADELTQHDIDAGIYDLDREQASDSPLYQD